MNMQVEEIIGFMKELGFTEYEAKVYISLLTKHPATAYAISQNSGVPHSRVYDIARRLINKGAAILYGKNPDSFSPIAPEELIKKIKRDHSRFINNLEQKLQKITFVSDFDPVWNISQPEEAIKITKEIIASANEKIYLGLWDDELKELLPVIKRSYQRGVQVYFLIYGSKRIDFGSVLYHGTKRLSGVDELGHTIDCVVDSEYCISGSLGKTSPCQVIWTKNRGLVKSIEEYIIHDFYLAEIQKKFGKEIEDAFGQNLSKLRNKFQK